MSQRRAFRPGNSASFGHNVHVASTSSGRMPQNTSRISDTRKNPPPFINFEEHLNASNGQFTIPALNFSSKSPASILLDRVAPVIPLPSAQNQFAVEGIPGRQPSNTIPSPTPALVGEPDNPTGPPGGLNTSHDVLLTPRSASRNTQTSQFPTDARPRKPFRSSRVSNQGSSVHEMPARTTPFAQSAQSYSTDTALLQKQPVAPPVPPSGSDRITRTPSESDFDPRLAKRRKTSHTIQTRKGPGDLQDQGGQGVIHTSGANGSPDWTSGVAHPYPLRDTLQAMDIHQLGDENSYSSSPQLHDDAILEEGRHPARSSSAEGEYLYPIDTKNNYSGTPRQSDLFRGVDPIGSQSFNGKLDLYRHKKSEEYERASQHWAECSLEEWLAGPDEILSEFMALFDRVTENLAGNLETFSKLGRTLDDHESLVLDKRELMLVEAKAALLTGGGHLAAVKLRSV